MGSLGTAGLLSLVLAFAAGAAVVGFLPATVRRTPRRRTRNAFAVGVICGVLAGRALRGRHAAATVRGIARRRRRRALVGRLRS